MTLNRLQSLALAALIPAAALTVNLPALAQSPPATPPAAAAPDTPTAAPTVTPPATPAVPAAPPTPPAAPAAETPAAPTTPAPPAAAETTPAPATPAPTTTADAFGEEIILPGQSVVMLRGSAKWDSAFETLIESIKSLTATLEKLGTKAAGNPLIIYTATDDAGFTYSAAIPVDQAPKNLPKEYSVGKSPEGRSLKFVHRGSYDTMDNTYEAITNYLDEKKLEAKDTFIEEYTTNPLTTAEDKLVINVYVPMK